MISPNSFCGFIFTRAIDMDLDLPILQNPWTKMKKTIWFINRKVLGARKFFWKQIKAYLKLFDIAKNCFTTLSPDNYIDTLSTNQKNETIVRDANNKQSPANQFLVLRWTLKWDLDP